MAKELDTNPVKEMMAKYANVKEVSLLALDDDEIDELERLEYGSCEDDFEDEQF